MQIGQTVVLFDYKIARANYTGDFRQYRIDLVNFVDIMGTVKEVLPTASLVLFKAVKTKHGTLDKNLSFWVPNELLRGADLSDYIKRANNI